jgi:hypothetical protein
MALSDRWKTQSAESMARFAAAWFAEMQGDAPTEDSNVGQTVIMMNFLAPPDQQWLFIREAVALSTTDDELGHIAAGPLEHILGHHGEEYISIVEELAAQDKKFARMLTGAWQYMMPENVWGRVQAIQAGVTNPLVYSKPKNGDAEPGAAADRGNGDGLPGR